MLDLLINKEIELFKLLFEIEFELNFGYTRLNIGMQVIEFLDRKLLEEKILVLILVFVKKQLVLILILTKK